MPGGEKRRPGSRQQRLDLDKGLRPRPAEHGDTPARQMKRHDENRLKPQRQHHGGDPLLLAAIGRAAAAMIVGQADREGRVLETAADIEWHAERDMIPPEPGDDLFRPALTPHERIRPGIEKRPGDIGAPDRFRHGDESGKGGECRLARRKTRRHAQGRDGRVERAIVDLHGTDPSRACVSGGHIHTLRFLRGRDLFYIRYLKLGRRSCGALDPYAADR